MCLVAVAWRAHGRYPLIVAGNRDEFHARPSAAAAWWDEAAQVFGGRDLAAGGSWLAISRSGRFAVVTNHPGRPRTPEHTASRGHLVRDFVSGSQPTGRFVDAVQARENRYAGFCLIAGTPVQLRVFVSPGAGSRTRWTLRPGISAISNSAPESPWPKALHLQAEMHRLLDGPDIREQDLLDILARREPVSDDSDSSLLSRTPFVLGETYGTRASTLILIDATRRCRFIERSFDASGGLVAEQAAEFRLS